MDANSTNGSRNGAFGNARTVEFHEYPTRDSPRDRNALTRYPARTFTISNALPLINV